MPTLREIVDMVVKRISALTREATSSDLTDGEFLAVDKTDGYTRKMTVANFATWVLGRIKSLATSITAFRTGDVIPVDGPSGTAKMSKDDLLAVTAQNALAGNVAPAFDPNRDEDHKYLAGESVTYEGKTYIFKVDHYGAWAAADVYFDSIMSTAGSDARGNYFYPFAAPNSSNKSIKYIIGLQIKNRVENVSYQLRVVRKNYLSSGGYQNQFTIAYHQSGVRHDIDLLPLTTTTTKREVGGLEVLKSFDGNCIAIIDWSLVADGYSFSVAENANYNLSEKCFSNENNAFLGLLNEIEKSYDFRGGYNYPFAYYSKETKYLKGILGLQILNRDPAAVYLVRVIYKNAQLSAYPGEYCYQLVISSYKNGSRTDYILLDLVRTTDKVYRNVEMYETPSGNIRCIIDWRLIPDGTRIAVADNSKYYVTDSVFSENNTIFLKLASMSSGDAQEIMQAHLQQVNPHNITKEMLGISDVTTSAAGLMTPEDKQKLDSITANINYSISGSGVAKNASSFGFLPSATASENSEALKDALSTSGNVLVDIPGVYYLDESIPLKSNTKLTFGNGVFVYRANKGNGEGARHQFYNEHYDDPSVIDENIEIDGLNYDYTVNRVSGDLPSVLGCRGMLMFCNVKNLTIKNLKVYNAVNDGDFTIQVSNFDNVFISNCNIDSLKDGVHFGPGKNFIVEKCRFHTNDDAIALNAVDYSASNPSYGNIENGVIRNIYFYPAGTFNNGRGIYSLVGSWTNWSSGLVVQKYGGIVVSDGRIYVTNDANGPTTETAVSTVQPTHSSGSVTGSDGIRWLMKQDLNVVSSAVLKNITIRDVLFDRVSIQLFKIHMGGDSYIATYTQGATPPINENILLDNVCSNVYYNNHVNSDAPVKGLKIVNSRMSNSYPVVSIGKNGTGITEGSTILLNSNNYEAGGGNGAVLVKAVSDFTVRAKVAASMTKFTGVTWSVDGNVTIDKDI